MNIDLNCDLGEGEPLLQTEALMRAITSCNVACGGHAGDERSMRDTVHLAMQLGVAVGAHPSFLDRANFGRSVQPIDETGLQQLLTEQVGALNRVMRSLAVPLHHVKLHGALYNLVEADESLAHAYVAWAEQNFPGMPLVGLAHGCVARVAGDIGVRVAREFFADRAYNDDGTLVSRDKSGAVLEDAAAICERVLHAIKDRCLATAAGKIIDVDAETVCVHGDTPTSIQIVQQLRRSLRQAGIEARTF